MNTVAALDKGTSGLHPTARVFGRVKRVRQALNRAGYSEAIRRAGCNLPYNSSLKNPRSRMRLHVRFLRWDDTLAKLSHES
jgi:hypothetical protein